MLTGDRQETAINIGFSCRLLNEDLSLIVFNESTFFETKDVIQRRLEGFRRQSKDSTIGVEEFALVIDGKTLDYALEDELKLQFLELAKLCKTVICCRVSPLQKALVVKLVRDNVSGVTLAIGDGANDVSMIQTAHIGLSLTQTAYLRMLTCLIIRRGNQRGRRPSGRSRV